VNSLWDSFAPWIPGAAGTNGAAREPLQVILSFDVEEHYRIEAAAGLAISSECKGHYRDRLEVSTHWVLGELARRDIKATFFIIGETAIENRQLVLDIFRAGHEVASHGWDHRRLHHFTPSTFRKDVLNSKDALERITGEAVVGYRAPTFSIVRDTAWALDVLAEAGIQYDSSIFPIVHDRYGIPDAPRFPFRARGPTQEVLELPPASWRVLRHNIPAGGGGYFRLLPPWVLRRAIHQVRRQGHPPVATLYFHPWEFDPEQHKLPLGWLGRLRTYAGISHSRGRLAALLGEYAFVRAVDVARHLRKRADALPSFAVSPTGVRQC
jgi:polysaccharide deacetylase family protein (PEP-CTERM system associated)